MRMSMGLQARQMQVQKLAPRMIQSMEILQMPTMGLQERIEQEMNENPLLEQQDVDPMNPDEGSDDDPRNADTRSEEERELTHRQQSTSAEVQRLEARLNQLRADIARLAERSQMLIDFIVAGSMLFALTMVLTYAIGCWITAVMHGPPRDGDAFPAGQGTPLHDD